MHVRVEDRGEAAVILGDVVVHEEQLRDPRLVYASDGDAAAAAQTRVRMLGALAEEGVPVIAAHLVGPARIEREHDGFRWERL